MIMLIVKCDRCGHIIENDEYFMKNRIGYTKDEMQK